MENRSSARSKYPSTLELTEILKTLGHDIKEPLVTLKGYGDLLKSAIDHKEWEKAKQYSFVIEEAIQSIEIMVGNLNAFNRSILDKPSRRERVDCARLFRSIVGALQGSIDAANATVDVPWEALPTIESHSIALYHLFLNLISNAIKHRDPRRPVRISIRYRRTYQQHQFFIADTGRGIPERHRRSLLNPRLSFSTPLERTRGLGLAIVGAIIDSLRGTVRIQSKEGSGSTFIIGLPLK